MLNEAEYTLFLVAKNGQNYNKQENGDMYNI